MNDWQPMHTAPKDTPVLVCVNETLRHWNNTWCDIGWPGRRVTIAKFCSHRGYSSSGPVPGAWISMDSRASWSMVFDEYRDKNGVEGRPSVQVTGFALNPLGWMPIPEPLPVEKDDES